jgi:HEAT repeat protein
VNCDSCISQREDRNDVKGRDATVNRWCSLRLLSVFLVGLFVFGTAVHGDESELHSHQSPAELVRQLASAEGKLQRRAIAQLRTIVRRVPVDDTIMVPLVDADASCSPSLVVFRHEMRPLLSELKMLLASNDEDVVRLAVSIIVRLGAEAQSAFEHLKKIANDDDVPGAIRWEATCAMLFVAPETVAVIPHVLPGPNAFRHIIDDRQEASGMQEKQTAFVQLMESTVAAAVLAKALFDSGHTKVEVPHLLKAMSIEYPTEVRSTIACTLGELREEASAAVSFLRQAARDDDSTVARLAAVAVLRIQMDPSIIPALADDLRLKGHERRQFEEECRDLFQYEKKERQQVLATVADDTEYFAPLLRKTLRRGHGHEKRSALRVLCGLGTAAEFAAPEVQNLLRDKDPETRELATQVLARIRGSDGLKSCQ